jgi:hypothetical protein
MENSLSGSAESEEAVGNYEICPDFRSRKRGRSRLLARIARGLYRYGLKGSGENVNFLGTLSGLRRCQVTSQAMTAETPEVRAEPLGKFSAK